MLLLNHYFPLSTDQILTIIGYLFLTTSAILVFFQIRINLQYDKRKEAINFCYDRIAKELFPLLFELKSLFGKDILIFTSQETFLEHLKKNSNAEQVKQLRKLILDILNFYERMSIGILKNVYDEDICYDDNGFNLIYFYKWVSSFIQELRNQYQEDRLFVNFEEIAERWKHHHSAKKITHSKYSAKLRRKNTIEHPRI